MSDRSRRPPFPAPAIGPLVAMLFLLCFPGRERTLFLLAILAARRPGADQGAG